MIFSSLVGKKLHLFVDDVELEKPTTIKYLVFSINYLVDE